MTTTPETTEAPEKTPTAEEVEQETRKKLAEAKAEVDPKASAIELFQSFLKDYKKLDHQGRLERVVMIITAIISGNLSGNKPKPEEVPGVEPQAKETGTEATADSAEGKPPKGKEEADSSPPIDTTNFRSGSDIVESLKKTFPGVDVQGEPVALKTAIMKNRPGAPGWTKQNTDDWSYETAGNTDDQMAQGIYCIESAQAPDGYSRQTEGKIPQATADKLTKIAVALRTDPRMKLFTGIAMTVDGVEVMMVKEIHMHPRGSASDYLCQPHTGVSYLMKTS